jgi:hypothetical protein
MIRDLLGKSKSPRSLTDVLSDGRLPSLIQHEGLVIEQHVREGRFQRSLSLIASFAALLSGLEVTYEHYRGSYSQQIMYTPVILSALLTVSGILAALSRRAARTVLPLLSLLTMIDGAVGFYFHVRGVARKPGGWRIPIANIVMGPPLFAPLLFAVSGYLGLIASMLRREGDENATTGFPGMLPSSMRPRPVWLSVLPHKITREGMALEQHVREGKFQKHVAAAAALAALFSGFEALYSHYKNNFAYPKSQWSPILLTPIMLVAGLGTIWSKRIARTALPAASLLALLDGSLGFYFHARGVLRRPGGTKLPLYNVIYGPPIFAPLLLAASGFMGALASLLRRAD